MSRSYDPLLGNDNTKIIRRILSFLLADDSGSLRKNMVLNPITAFFKAWKKDSESLLTSTRADDVEPMKETKSLCVNLFRRDPRSSRESAFHEPLGWDKSSLFQALRRWLQTEA